MGMTPPVSRRLARDTRNKVLGGVCSGLARRFGLSPTALRWAFVISCVLPGPQFIAYLVLWVVMPADDRP
jgi:phage shock protein PspC (stress-responsive transcriptional regulator)